MVLLSDDDYSGDEWCHLVGELLICIPRCPLFGKHSYCFWNCSLRSARPSAMSEMCVYAKRAKPTFYLLEIFRKGLRPSQPRARRINILKQIHFLCQGYYSTGCAQIVENNQTFCWSWACCTTVRITPLFFGGGAAVAFGVTLRFICCVKSALLVSTAPTYDLLKAANLDQDERGSDGEDVTCGPSRPFFSHLLIALSHKRRGTIRPPSDSYHPPHLCPSPWCVLLDSILSTSIQASDFSLFYLHPPDSSRFSPPEW